MKERRESLLQKLGLATDGDGVPDGADDGEEEDGAQVVEEEPVGHEVAGVQDDGRQHVEEERLGRQRRDAHRVGVVEQQADDDAHHDQQARLGEDRRQFRRHVESWSSIKRNVRFHVRSKNHNDNNVHQ